MVKQSSTTVIEFAWGEAKNRSGSCMDQGRGRVPWLDLLSENELDFGGILLFHERKDGRVERSEHFDGKLGAIVINLDHDKVCEGSLQGKHRQGQWRTNQLNYHRYSRGSIHTCSSTV